MAAPGGPLQVLAVYGQRLILTFVSVTVLLTPVYQAAVWRLPYVKVLSWCSHHKKAPDGRCLARLFRQPRAAQRHPGHRRAADEEQRGAPHRVHGGGVCVPVCGRARGGVPHVVGHHAPAAQPPAARAPALRLGGPCDHSQVLRPQASRAMFFWAMHFILTLASSCNHITTEEVDTDLCLC